MSSERIEELKQQITELKRHWPKHSVSPGLIRQLDDLEEELEQEMEKVENQQNKSAANSTD
jgi:iron-sulfur cluster repair protein YtfE (RIC family)